MTEHETTPADQIRQMCQKKGLTEEEIADQIRQMCQAKGLSDEVTKRVVLHANGSMEMAEQLTRYEPKTAQAVGNREWSLRKCGPYCPTPSDESNNK
jgi:hypothetical protein